MLVRRESYCIMQTDKIKIDRSENLYNLIAFTSEQLFLVILYQIYY